MNPLLLFQDYTFAQTLTGTLIVGVCAGALGPLVYLRRQSLLADAISHSSLPGLLTAFVVATWLGFNGRNSWLLVTGAVLSGLIAVTAINYLPRIAPIRQDAAMAAVLTTFFSLGMLGMQYIARTPLPGKGGIQDFLLGNASTLTRLDILSALVMGGVGLLLLSSVHNWQAAAVFDVSFARAQGVQLHILSALTFLVLTVVTVNGVKVVGVVLMVAVVISPAAAARQWVTRLPAFIAVSALLGGISAAVGSYLSILYSLPTGPVIVVVQAGIVSFALATSPRRKKVAA